MRREEKKGGGSMYVLSSSVLPAAHVFAGLACHSLGGGSSSVAEASKQKQSVFIWILEIPRKTTLI